MSVSAISGKSTTSADATTSTAAKASSTALGKNDFLKLMIKQMQYQDPLNPMDNAAFVAQLAQFSSLEQTTNLNTTMESFVNNAMSMQAGNMIGWTVTGIDGDGNTVKGMVTGVEFSGGSPVLQVGNSKLPLSGMTEMSSGTAQS